MLLGTKGEEAVCRNIAHGSRSPVVVVTGVSLGVTMALIADAELLVANDSGPLHLAAALGRPLVGIYGPTEPGRVGPWGNARWVVRENSDCAVCRSSTPRRRVGHTCLTNLPVARVLSLAEAALAEGAPAEQCA